jgi:hypothetical protein
MLITNCIWYNGRVYCFDQEKNQIICVTTVEVKPSDCPDCVLTALLANGEREEQTAKKI